MKDFIFFINICLSLKLICLHKIKQINRNLNNFFKRFFAQKRTPKLLVYGNTFKFQYSSISINPVTRNTKIEITT